MPRSPRSALAAILKVTVDQAFMSPFGLALFFVTTKVKMFTRCFIHVSCSRFVRHEGSGRCGARALRRGHEVKDRPRSDRHMECVAAGKSGESQSSVGRKVLTSSLSHRSTFVSCPWSIASCIATSYRWVGPLLHADAQITCLPACRAQLGYCAYLSHIQSSGGRTAEAKD